MRVGATRGTRSPTGPDATMGHGAAPGESTAAPGTSVNIKRTLPDFTLNVAWECGDELTVLFGGSGSGKSMTLQCIAGLIAPDVGRIVFGGDMLFDSDSRTAMPPQRRRLGYVTQSCTLFPHMTVEGNIAYGLKGLPRDERDERIAEVIDALQLEGLRTRLPNALSGGQRQRAQLARALAGRPRALLLDEPFSALDAPIREEMRDVVREVRRRFDVPTVMVTHDLYEAYTMADRMVAYENGVVMQSGTPCELFKAPATPSMERLLSSERLYLLGQRP